MSINDGNATSRDRMPVAARGLEGKLGLAESLGLSLSIVAPSMATAFNVSLVVRAAKAVCATLGLLFAQVLTVNDVIKKIFTATRPALATAESSARA